RRGSARGAARQAARGAQHQLDGRGLKVPWRIRGKSSEDSQRNTGEQGRTDPVHRRDPYHRRRRPGWWRGRARHRQRVQAGAGAGELNLIGATTLNEYQKYIEKDAALERRFQPVYV